MNTNDDDDYDDDDDDDDDDDADDDDDDEEDDEGTAKESNMRNILTQKHWYTRLAASSMSCKKSKLCMSSQVFIQGI